MNQVSRREFDVLIVGGGHAGAQAAVMLRQLGFEGSIAMLNGEPELPYERPPLSKEYLAGDKPFERIMIRPAAFWGERKVETILGTFVTTVDAEAKTVTTDSGGTIGYGSLVWAAGGDPRKLTCPGADLAGVHAVRSRADVDRLMAQLPDITRVVIIGGGYIGLEAAAVLTKLGKHVTLLEMLDRVLARVAGPALSAFYEGEHRAHGVDLRTNTGVELIEGEDGHVTGVKLVDGTTVSADAVIVGIGIVPSVEPLITSGGAGGNGVFIDEFCRTNLPDVYAIGDCAAHANGYAEGETIRLESVQNANDQAATAARAIMGTLEPYKATPWFWSNQYDLRLQTVGLSSGHDVEVVRGDPKTRSFSVAYFRGGKLVALDCINMIKDYAQGRKLIEAKHAFDPVAVADPSIPLKDLLA